MTENLDKKRSRILRTRDTQNENFTENFAYDKLGQIKSVTSNFGSGSAYTRSYDYDGVGNLRQKTSLGRTINLIYNADNRLTDSNDSMSVDSGGTGNRTLAYDDRGNVTGLGNLMFDYDLSDQPIYASLGIGDGETSYRYDGNLRRVRSVHDNNSPIYNIYDSSGTLVHIDNQQTGEVTDYIAGAAGTLARAQNDVITFVHSDHLGSASVGTNIAGAVVWRRHYTPYGGEIKDPNDHVDAANDNQAGFTGHIEDADTGLTYMQARYYDPVIGRFLSIDPVTFMDTGNPGYFNRYAYTFNDPVNNIDPDGMQVGNKVQPTRIDRNQGRSTTNQGAANDNTAKAPSIGLASPLGAMAAGVMASPDQGLGAEIDGDGQQLKWLNAAAEFDSDGSGANRVNIQAQGRNVRKSSHTVKDSRGGNMASASANHSNPIPRAVVHGKIEVTRMKLHPKDQSAMASGFAKAHSMVNTMTTGRLNVGVQGYTEGQYRIDINVAGAIGP